jgi:uncharacterized membrane protein
VSSFFTSSEEEQILQAIKSAEERTSGEIRVHVESRCKKDPMERAVELFYSLGMETTQQRNGVLIYVATKDHKLAIIGDSGINQVVPKGFWDNALSIMRSFFKQNRYAEGICEAIKLAGEQLLAFFPYEANDSNELSNDISIGE